MIYDLDIDLEYNTEDAKQVIMKWFLENHNEMMQKRAKLSDMSNKQAEEYSIDQIEMIVKMQFQRQNYDFDNPNKESLFYVALSLVAIAKSFKGVDSICNSLIKVLSVIDKLKP